MKQYLVIRFRVRLVVALLLSVLILAAGLFWNGGGSLSWAAPRQNPHLQTVPPRPPTSEPGPPPPAPPDEPTDDDDDGDTPPTPSPVVADTPTPTPTEVLPAAAPSPTPTEVLPATASPTPAETPMPTQTPIPVETSAPGATPTTGLQFETITVSNAGSSYIAVDLQNTYISPVVICTVNYAHNSVPVVSRVNNVTSTSFDVRLQNPGDASSVSSDAVHCLVMEEGPWTLPDGRKVEARKYTSTVTDHAESGAGASWVGERQTYAHTYSNPVVLGQVMSENDSRWSVFWSRGGKRVEPPSASTLKVGKTVAEDPDRTRADEVVGYIVIEQGLGAIDGVKYEASLGTDTVAGIGKAPHSYTFAQLFTEAPDVAIANLAGISDGDGGWAYLYGASPFSATQIFLAIDEDQTYDSERSHEAERVGYVVFEDPVAYAAPIETPTRTPTESPTPVPSPRPTETEVPADTAAAEEEDQPQPPESASPGYQASPPYWLFALGLGLFLVLGGVFLVRRS
jgi:hypothetical protein